VGDDQARSCAERGEGADMGVVGTLQGKHADEQRMARWTHFGLLTAGAGAAAGARVAAGVRVVGVARRLARLLPAAGPDSAEVVERLRDLRLQDGQLGLGKLIDLLVDGRHLVQEGGACGGLEEGDDNVQLLLGECLCVEVDDCGLQRLPAHLGVNHLRGFFLKVGELHFALRRWVGTDRLIRRVGDLLQNGGGGLLHHTLGVQQHDHLSSLGVAGSIVGASGERKAEDEGEQQARRRRRSGWA